MTPDLLDPVDGVPLSEAERAFAERLRELFARVDARAPEKGVRALIRRARKTAAQPGRSEADVHEHEDQGALRRTERRLESAARSACRRQ